MNQDRIIEDRRPNRQEGLLFFVGNFLLLKGLISQYNRGGKNSSVLRKNHILKVQIKTPTLMLLDQEEKRYSLGEYLGKWVTRNTSGDFYKRKNMKNVAYLAGGCFWGLEELFRKEKGVIDIVAGYTGGENDDPTYEYHPGHAEALEITYEDTETNFRELLDFFFRIHDPTTLNRQGGDIGTSYRSAIFYRNEEERKQAEDFIAIVNDSGRWASPVVTTLEPFRKFYPAEDYHQDYLQKNPGGYTCHVIRFGKYV